MNDEVMEDWWTVVVAGDEMQDDDDDEDYNDDGDDDDNEDCLDDDDNQVMDSWMSSGKSADIRCLDLDRSDNVTEGCVRKFIETHQHQVTQLPDPAPAPISFLVCCLLSYSGTEKGLKKF